jgi:hypothetical protein
MALNPASNSPIPMRIRQKRVIHQASLRPPGLDLQGLNAIRHHGPLWMPAGLAQQDPRHQNPFAEHAPASQLSLTPANQPRGIKADPRPNPLALGPQGKTAVFQPRDKRQDQRLTICSTLVSIADTITFRPDDDTLNALAVLTCDGTPVSAAVRAALIDAARRKAAASIRAEAEALAADEADRAEAAQVLRDMETLRAW